MFVSVHGMPSAVGTLTDGTKYSKFHSSNYLTHHLASISLAAVYTDAVHVEEGVDGLKQRALALAPCASE